VIELFARSSGMREAVSLAERVSSTETNVLITGESGAGKDLLASFIHSRSRRAVQPFVKIDCATLPGDLLESELFGYERGAFTGAVEARAGRLEADEVNEALAFQKLKNEIIALQDKWDEYAKARAIAKDKNGFAPPGSRFAGRRNATILSGLICGAFMATIRRRRGALQRLRCWRNSARVDTPETVKKGFARDQVNPRSGGTVRLHR
jgi:hypothetical protein